MTLARLARTPPPRHRLGHPPRPRAGRRLARAAGRRAHADLGLDGAAHARRLRRSARPARARGARRAGLARCGASCAPHRAWAGWRWPAPARWPPPCCAPGRARCPRCRRWRPAWSRCWRWPAACWPSCRGAWRRCRSPGLAVLALPLLSSLQFYAGYPLRVITAEASRWLLAPGFSVAREGSSLLIDGRLVIVDAPCSGVQMVWLGYFTACAVALWARRGDRGFLARLPVVGLLVLAGNIVRNSVLVGLRRRGPRARRPGLHEALGLARARGGLRRHRARDGADAPAETRRSAAIPGLVTSAGGRRVDTALLSAGSPTASSTASRTRRRSRCVMLLCLLWSAASALRAPAAPAADSDASTNGPANGTACRCARWRSSEVEQRFAERFPGAIARMTDGEQMLVLRQVERAHAHAASGRRLLPRARLPHRAGAAGARCPGPTVALFRRRTATVRKNCAFASASSTPRARLSPTLQPGTGRRPAVGRTDRGRL